MSIRILLAGSLPLIVLAGCSKPAPHQLRGVVRISQQPLNSGTVVLFLPNGTHRGVPIGKDGEFSASGIPAGPVRIAVYNQDPAPRDVRRQNPQQAEEIRKAAGWVRIPARYSDPGRSGWSFTLPLAFDTVELDLTP
jgi:hypothetical protein